MKSGTGASGTTFFLFADAFELSDNTSAPRISSFLTMQISCLKKYRLLPLCGGNKRQGVPALRFAAAGISAVWETSRGDPAGSSALPQPALCRDGRSHSLSTE